MGIFSNMFVNLYNEPNVIFEVNKLIKFFNNFVAITKKDRLNLIKLLLTLLKKITLMALYILQLKTKLE